MKVVLPRGTYSWNKLTLDIVDAIWEKCSDSEDGGHEDEVEGSKTCGQGVGGVSVF